jgi:hypothetical protein
LRHEELLYVDAVKAAEPWFAYAVRHGGSALPPPLD